MKAKDYKDLSLLMLIARIRIWVVSVQAKVFCFLFPFCCVWLP
ncbi:hypothetical protein SLEP1_g12250 [Rubroshorea leprosula]|uniref:Uncharacterized protein n=1 Tax=Rubroshorea leprosula TaxID=152421 RepID=A0AAV5INB3_9ROSI|nr:hypothetical protein SLEP1_g12250 [Rubroshorea leprosula]